ncbi:MAG: MFS transporter [Pseudomonadales bacterium]|nr:MFS transporter [Pseudomonadales bacterium]
MASAAQSPETTPETRWGLLAGLWLLYTAFGLTATSLAPLVTLIEADLDISHAAMGSVMGAWQLVYIFAAMPGGVMLDRLGSQKALLIGGILVALSAVGRALATDYWTLLLAVGLFGLGGPVISSGAPKVVAQLFTGSQRGLAMGIYMTGPAIGGVVSLTMTHSVLLPTFGDWRTVMLLWSAFAVVAGVVWFSLAGLSGLRAREQAAMSGPPTPQGRVMLELARAPAVRVVLLMSVGVFLFNHGLNNWLPEVLRSQGLSVIQAGYWAALPTVIGIGGSLLIPRLATPDRRFRILLALCGAALLASLLLQAGGGPLMTLGLIMQGIARSALMTVLVLTLVELPGIGETRAGTASGMFFSAAEIGGVLGPLGLGILYDATGNFHGALAGLSVVATLLAAGTVYLTRLARDGGQKAD